MSLFSTTEDEDFFNPTLSSNLASLFGTSMTVKQDGNSSLTYTAPKQPRSSGQETPKASPKPTTQSAVVCSKVVDVFKLSDKSHTSQGKCGLAIIGNQSLKAYEIIVYKTKQDIITRAKLKMDFTFTVQTNNFASFCDDQKQRWSVHFENTNEVSEFLQHVKNLDGKVVCDNKDSEMGDKSQNRSTNDGISKTEETAAEGNSEKDKDSDSTSDNSSTQTKANILSRMAKMGQSILPLNLHKQSCDHSDSETDDHTQSRKPIKKRPKPVVVNGQSTSDNAKNTNSPPLSLQTLPAPEFVVINGQVLPKAAIQPTLPPAFSSPLYNHYNIQNIPNQLMLSQPQPAPMSDSLHVFIAENRTHNCELRMNMSQLSSKLDKVLELQKNQCVSSADVPEIVNELELKIADKGRELEECLKLINQLQEQQSTLQETIISSSTLIDNLKQENEAQKTIIAEQKQKVNQLEKEKSLIAEQIAQDKFIQQNLDEAEQTICELKKTINDQQVDLQKFKNVSIETNKENQNFPIIVNQLNQEIDNLKNQLANKNSQADLFSSKLKQSINLLYQQIMENFEDPSLVFQSAHIKQILSQKLKAATFMLIQEFQNDFKDADGVPSVPDNDSPPAVPKFE